MAFFNGEGEMDRKSQSNNSKGLYRVDQQGPKHQQMTKGLTSGHQGTGYMSSHQYHSGGSQTYHHTQHYTQPGAGTGSYGAATVERTGNRHGNVMSSAGDTLHLSKNQRVLDGVRDLLSSNRQMWYHSEGTKKTVKDFEASFDELKNMAAGKDPNIPKTTSGGQRHLEEELKKANLTIEELTHALNSHKLSATMNTQLSVDETTIENVSIKNRPLNIAADYTMLCSTEWHAAKENLDKVVREQHEEELKLSFLSKIFETAEEEAKSLRNMLFRDIDKALSEPLSWTTKGHHASGKPGIEASPALKNALSDHLRQSSENVDTTELFKLIQKDAMEKCGRNSNYKLFLKEKPALDYMISCASLAWKMVIQRPPMTFDCSSGVGKGFDDKTQELHWGSPDPNKGYAAVNFYVHPALNHGERLMVKGRVWIK